MRTARPSPAAAETYTPDLPAEDWERIRTFVVQSAQAAAPRLSYPTSAILNAVAHHVDWCVNVAGYPMRADAVFRRDVIGAAASVVPTTHSSSRGRRRSLLLRVGEALEVIPSTAKLPPLAAASPIAPYGRSEIQEIIRWSLNQPDNKLGSARALVTLGLGAGLPARELSMVRPVDIIDSGFCVRVAGDTARLVPVSDEWGTQLKDLSIQALDAEAPLFRPTVAWHKNMVTNFIATSVEDGMRPTVQRMRATWLVERLSAGTPMQDLLAAAGLQSMDALVRYERFLPPPSPAALGGTPQ